MRGFEIEKIFVVRSVVTFTYILFYSILLDYQSLYGHGKEDESGLSSWCLRTQ